MINTRIKIPELGHILPENMIEATTNARRGSSEQPGALTQSMFEGVSGVNITGGHFSIIGHDQTWRPSATVCPVDRRTTRNDYSSEDSLCPPINRSTFAGASNVNINRGYFSTIGCENTSGAADPNDPAPQVSYQSMFTDAKNITMENSDFTIVAGRQLNAQYDGAETHIKKVKSNSTSHAKVFKSKNDTQAMHSTSNRAKRRSADAVKRNFRGC